MLQIESKRPQIGLVFVRDLVSSECSVCREHYAIGFPGAGAVPEERAELNARELDGMIASTVLAAW